MKTTLAVTGLLAVFAAGAMAQSPDLRPQTVSAAQPPQPSVSQPPSPQISGPRLEAVLTQIQKATGSLNSNLAKLRIEKWRTDPDQRAQLQKLASSLQRNITFAVPGLMNDVQNSRGSVSSTFKLYHNMNVVYEYLNSLTDAAGSLGKREEYEPLAEDAAALDSAREGLSSYIEQTSVMLENPPRPSANAVSSADGEPVGGGRKIIVEEVSGPVPKATKKKAATTPKDGAAKDAVPKDGSKDASSKDAPKSTAKPSPAKPSTTASGKPAPTATVAPSPVPK